MDVLSEVLSAFKLEGALFFNGEFSAPWCIWTARSNDAAKYLSAKAGHVILYHYLIEGQAYARLPDGQRQQLTAGDIIIFPHGDDHFLGNGEPAKPVDSFQTFAKNLTKGFKVSRFGGGGEITRFVCGFMACEARLSEIFLAGLPKILRVHVADGPSGEWLANSIRFSAGEDSGADAGSGLVFTKLSELLFVETLRRYINALPSDQVGWLAGARDPVVSQALALLHKEPADPWTVSNLARRVGLSRTRLAERFRHFLGESPMAYLAQWRLKLGAEMLQSTENSVAEVAAAVGYGSEVSFDRAFKRAFESPPAQFRRKHKAPTDLSSQSSRPAAPRN
ncbi:MAG: AraC family transcriptional regulator [Acidobacteriota bacterium]